MNYAAYVKIIMPHLSNRSQALSLNLFTINGNMLKKKSYNKLDTLYDTAYFYLHNNLGETHVDKNNNSQKTRNFQSTFRTGKNSFISKQLLFRPSRPSSSKIRDVTPCNGRGDFQESSRRALWCISPHLVRNRGSFCAFWVGRPFAAAARAKGSTQTRYKRHDFYRELPQREQKAECQGAYRLNKDSFQYFRTSSQRRKGDCSQKKISQDKRVINLPNNAVNLYESLRKQVLEGAVRPQGLCVFIYHGMLRGLQILAENPTESPTSLPETRECPLPSIPLNIELVHLLANMVSYLKPEVKHVY